MRKSLFIYLIAVLLCMQIACAAPPSGDRGTSAISASDTNIALNGSYRNIIIKTDTGAATIYVSLDGATTTVGGTNTFEIDGGGSLNRLLAPAISHFHYIGASATGNISYEAW